jgi:hypothetical protein
MKIHYLKLSIVLFSLTLFTGCQKEEDAINDGSNEALVKSDWLAKYKREIVAKDSTGNNSIFVAIYSNDEQKLESYIAQNVFKLITSNKEIVEKTSCNYSSGNILKSEGNSNFQPDVEPQIYVELVTSNLNNEIKSYYLDISKSTLKDGPPPGWYGGEMIGYVTPKWGNFIGITFMDWGWDVYVTAGYKANEWNLIWKDYPGYPIWLGGYNPTYMAWISGSYYKILMAVQPCVNQKSQNYRIAYSKGELKNAQCTYIGSFDGAHCYVGSAPSGTRAFIWGTSFYYTPVNGNQCPLPGSTYDGNCHYRYIPSKKVNDAFIWNNSWYVDLDCVWPEYE